MTQNISYCVTENEEKQKVMKQKQVEMTLIKQQFNYSSEIVFANF